MISKWSIKTITQFFGNNCSFFCDIWRELKKQALIRVRPIVLNTNVLTSNYGKLSTKKSQTKRDEHTMHKANHNIRINLNYSST